MPISFFARRRASLLAGLMAGLLIAGCGGGASLDAPAPGSVVEPTGHVRVGNG